MSDETTIDLTDGELLAKHAAGTSGYHLPDGTRTRSAERCIASWRAGAVVAGTRGRPVGSKNKPKNKPDEAPIVETVVEASPEPVEAPAPVAAPQVSDNRLEARIERLEALIDRLLMLTSRVAETQSVAAESLRHQWLGHE
jgi:hypothetical protein